MRSGSSGRGLLRDLNRRVPAAQRYNTDCEHLRHPSREQNHSSGWTTSLGADQSPAATASTAPDSSGAAPKGELMSWSRSNIGGMHKPLELCLAPNRREPRLPLSRQAGRPVVMMQLNETGRNHVVAPRLEVEEAGVAAVANPFFVVPPRI